MATLEFLDPNRNAGRAEHLRSTLSSLIVGQDESVRHIVRAYQTHLAGLSPVGRPIANFLFLGPTGCGKTRTVEATAEALLRTSRAIVKIDCGEFQHSHEIAKLIGSPPGYLGHRETHPLLSQEMLNQHHTTDSKVSFVLFDEIEKASDALWNLLLGILDKATLTLGDNRRVDFSASMIFLTSNLGAGEMSSLIAPRVGFHPPMNKDTKLSARISNAGIAAARRKFTPEFINRLDNIVVFRSLHRADLSRILDIELALVQKRIYAACANSLFRLDVTASAREFLLVEGTDLRYGARHLKRAIERLLVQPLSSLIASGQTHRGDCINVSHCPGSVELVFSRVSEAARMCNVVRRAA